MRESVRALILERLTEYIRERYDPRCIQAIEYWEDAHSDGDRARIELTVQYVGEFPHLGLTWRFDMSLSDMIQNLED